MGLDHGYVTLAAIRRKELPTRIVAALLMGACAWSLAPSINVLVWLAAVCATQLSDYLVFKPLRRWPDRAVSAWRRLLCTVSVGANASIYASLALIFWFSHSDIGKAAGMVFLASCLLHVMLHLHHARAVFLASAAPFALPFAGLPLLDAALSRHVEWGPLIGVEAAGLLFLGHLVVAVRHAAQTAGALRESMAQAQEREASSRMLFERNPVAMWLVDLATTGLIDANAAAESLFGLSRASLQTKTVLELVHPDDRPEATARHAEGSLGKARGLRDWRLLTADGGSVMIRAFADSVTVDGRDALLFALVDVTERARVEVELEAARDAAEAANRAKSEFLANMSHEIRTPLNGVVGVADMLSRGRLAKGQREMIELIRASGATLDRLLSDVLDLARVESGHVEIRVEAFDPCQAARDVIALAGPRAMEKSVALSCELADTVKERAGGGVLGDPVRLKQILTNLVSNAVKFTDAGEVRLTVSRSQDEAGWCFVVSDTGIGFDASAKDAVFGRFRQADGSITRRFGGTGLGLAISRQLAERMGGRLDCESRPGQGSTFTLALPLADAIAERPATAAPHPIKPLSHSLAGARVLLADDHPTNRKVVELFLQSTGVVLHSVENGAEALAAFRAACFDIVLMDMQMPVMDGLAATRAIRLHEHEAGASPTPIVMLTANGLPEHLAAAIEAGADRHLTKPITPGALITTIDAMVAARQDLPPRVAARALSA